MKAIGTTNGGAILVEMEAREVMALREIRDLFNGLLEIGSVPDTFQLPAMQRVPVNDEVRVVKTARVKTARVNKTTDKDPRRTLGERVCAGCGKTFTAHRKDQKCCNKACSKKSHNKDRGAKEDPAAGGGRKCVFCGKTFKPRSNRQMFCTDQCKANSKLQTRRNELLATGGTSGHTYRLEKIRLAAERLRRDGDSGVNKVMAAAEEARGE